MEIDTSKEGLKNLLFEAMKNDGDEDSSSESSEEENESSIYVVKDMDDFYELMEKAKDKLCVDFFAYWCGPCIQIEPDEEEFCESVKDEIPVYRVDCDNKKTLDLMKFFKVLCAPTFVIVRNKVKLAVVIGAKLDKVKQIVNKFKDKKKDS